MFFKQKKNIAFIIFLLIAGLGFLGWKYWQLSKENNFIQNTLSEKESALLQTGHENTDLIYRLETEKQRNDSFAYQIEEIAGTVGILKKLKETDEELLQKYSKIYFLNENYIPSSLSEIDENNTFGSRIVRVHAKIEPFLNNLIQAAKSDGMNLLVISGYRSFNEQNVLKDSYAFTYGSGANKFSADQGYSEHQLGTTIDFTTLKVADTFSGFSKTPEFKWLQENAYKYGFILSYPEGNSYYQFEPWHWRFVGTALAKTLHEEGKNFYDLDQREIDKHLINIFD